MTNINNILLEIALYGCARSKGIKRKKHMYVQVR